MYAPMLLQGHPVLPCLTSSHISSLPTTLPCLLPKPPNSCFPRPTTPQPLFPRSSVAVVPSRHSHLLLKHLLLARQLLVFALQARRQLQLLLQLRLPSTAAKARQEQQRGQDVYPASHFKRSTSHP